MLKPPSSAAIPGCDADSAGRTVSLILEPLSQIIHGDHRGCTSIVKSSTGIFIVCPLCYKLPIFSQGVIVNVFEFLTQKLLRIDILGLDILPDTMLMTRITALLMEEFQQVIPTVVSKLLEDSVCSI